MIGELRDVRGRGTNGVGAVSMQRTVSASLVSVYTYLLDSTHLPVVFSFAIDLVRERPSDWDPGTWAITSGLEQCLRDTPY